MAPMRFLLAGLVCSISLSPTVLPTAKPMSAAYRPGIGQTSIGSIPLSRTAEARIRVPLLACWWRIPAVLVSGGEGKRAFVVASFLRRRHTIVPSLRIRRPYLDNLATIERRSTPRPHLAHARSGACCRARARRGRTGSSGSTATTMQGRLAEVSSRLRNWCGACDRRLDRWPRQRRGPTAAAPFERGSTRALDDRVRIPGSHSAPAERAIRAWVTPGRPRYPWSVASFEPRCYDWRQEAEGDERR